MIKWFWEQYLVRATNNVRGANRAVPCFGALQGWLYVNHSSLITSEWLQDSDSLKAAVNNPIYLYPSYTHPLKHHMVFDTTPSNQWTNTQVIEWLDQSVTLGVPVEDTAPFRRYAGAMLSTMTKETFKEKSKSGSELYDNLQSYKAPAPPSQGIYLHHKNTITHPT
ncbi:hypothetical protein PPL_04967 [Heterostelium album PN500]|uniref:PNT domain-containing protein n=1 Tax=Heterostelium pallidum (strain ATCC 26659 / Pp 5 / PN500) TaxID=670386 RepID=D3B923_HETP5|nr:hypothetical protein PPL_04967 [Heterostelium album PN500]EFA82062.1 hypothetical protein PPL_04967 [Heterostelium album PN500]|eukprot:XP_020434179.1 hypothetical protein PPL_04967 [Heterostelium album PN500]